MGAFDIKYMPRTSVKGQVLADLIAEFTETPIENKSNEHCMDEKSVGQIAIQELLQWKVYVDGVANQKGSGVGLILISPEKLVVEKSLRLGFSATNNEAEYEALLEGMSIIHRIRGRSVTIFSDSRLVVSQVKSELEAKDERMRGYLTRVQHLQKNFESFDLQHLPRGGNTHVDSLATLATSSAQNLPRIILVEDLGRPLGKKGKMVYVPQVRVGPNWMDPIIQFLVKTFYQKTNQMPKRYVGRLLGFGYPRTRNCINDLSRGHTYYAYILKHQN